MKNNSNFNFLSWMNLETGVLKRQLAAAPDTERYSK